MKKRIIYIVLATLCLNFNLKAQEKYIISGSVLSSSDNSPLVGVTIKHLSDGLMTYSNDKGYFEIRLLNPTGKLRLSFVGFETVEVPISPSKLHFEVKLIPQTGSLKEVSIVSTGYQSISKERSTGSFAQINNELLNRRVSTDILSKLEGITPGLLFNRNTINGAAGQVDISVRGTNTLFANNQPLIVFDGFPYDGDVNNINPNLIESITILKDAAAASIWGVRSGNGVIVLTTKRGKANQKLSVEFNGNVTIGEKPDLSYNRSFLPSKDFIDIEKSLFAQGAYDGDLLTGYLPVSPVVSLLSSNKAGLITDAGLNSQLNELGKRDVRNDLSKYFYRKSILQQYGVNLKGGSDKTDYFFSLGDDRNLSSLVGNRNERTTISSSYNFHPIKNLTFSAQLNYIKSTTRSNSNIQNITMGNTGTIYPYATLVDQNGKALPIVKDYAASFIDTAGHGNFLNWQYKPYDELNNTDNRSTFVENRINLGLNYHFFKFLNADIKYQYINDNAEFKNNNNISNYYTRNLINQYTSFDQSGNILTPIPLGGILNQSASDLKSHRFRGQLNINIDWNQKNELTGIVGSEISNAVNQSNTNRVYGYNDQLFTNNSNIDFATNFPINPDGSSRPIPNNQSLSKATDRYISYYSNFGYTYDSRFDITASARIDKSNLFGVQTNQKSVPLYSLGTGWNISKERFYKIAWLPYLKLRATYGYNGNINKDATAATTIRQSSSSTYSGLPFAEIANTGNPDLRWEKTRIINIGIDLGSKENRITGSIEYYWKKGNDLFGYSPFAPSAGLTTFFGNTADLAGKGVEISINSKNINTAKFSWTTNFLLTHVVDNVTNYKAITNSFNYILNSNASSIFPLEGKSLYGLYSYSWEGLTHDKGNPQGLLNGKVSTNYDGIVSNTIIQDMVYNGSSRPTTFGSVRNNFNYNEFTLSINITYKLNYSFRRQSFISSGLPYSGNLDYYKRWRSRGDELKTNVPSLEYPPYTTSRDLFYQYSSTLVDKADHIRLQDISFGYNFNKRQYTSLPIKQLRIYGYVNNIGILWRANHDNLDPDLSNNTTVANYPLPKTYSLGINATF